MDRASVCHVTDIAVQIHEFLFIIMFCFHLCIAFHLNKKAMVIYS